MIKITQAIIVVMVLVSLISTYYEQDVAKRTYRFSQEEYADGSYKREYKTIEDKIKITINTYKYTYNTYRQKLYWDISIVILVLALLFFKRQEQKRLKNE